MSTPEKRSSLLRLPDGSEPRDAGTREGGGIRRAAERADAPSRWLADQLGQHVLVPVQGRHPGRCADCRIAGFAAAGFAPIAVPAVIAGLAVTRGRSPVPGRLVIAGIGCGALPPA